MMRLYLDEDVHEDIAKALRLRGYDVKTTKEADIDQLRRKIGLSLAVISPILTGFISNASKKVSDIAALSSLSSFR